MEAQIAENANALVVAFFVASTLMAAYLGIKFFKIKKQPMVSFGLGLILIAIAFLVWTYMVLFHPNNMGLLVSIGALPFMGAFIAFLVSAVSNVKAKYKIPLYAINLSILAIFIILRFFVFESNPGFTPEGFFAFNVDPAVLYFYALLLSFNFIPALYVVGRHIKKDIPRIGIELGLTLVAVGLVIMVTSHDESLQIINGTGIIFGFIAASLATMLFRIEKHIK